LALVNITRIYTGEDGQSHFEELTLPERETEFGWLTAQVPATGVIFRRTPPGGSIDFHTAPRRQFVIILEGAVEIECGDGSMKTLSVGDVMLADDTTGQGHISRETVSPRRSIFVPVPDDLDVSGWRA
jgi:uncharacterized cupin superfamily protein